MTGLMIIYLLMTLLLILTHLLVLPQLLSMMLILLRSMKKIDNSTSIFTYSISSVDSPQCHTTSSTIDPESVEDDIRMLMNHSLLESSQRTNVITADYTTRGRLFGAYTQRGLGITHASLKHPDVLTAIHKDKNNLSMTWLIAFGDFAGGKFWLESPIGTEPPPATRTAWEKNPRGEYRSVLLQTAWKTNTILS